MDEVVYGILVDEFPSFLVRPGLKMFAVRDIVFHACDIRVAMAQYRYLCKFTNVYSSVEVVEIDVDGSPKSLCPEVKHENNTD